MRRLLLPALLVLFTTPALCQVMLKDSLSTADGNIFKPKKLNYNLTLGSQFTAASGFGSGLNTYITPSISYNLNSRLRIGGGISIIQTNYFNARPYSPYEQNKGSNGNFTSALIFVDGTYIVNKRLSIYGSAYKQIPLSQDPLPYNPFNPVSSQGGQGINFNVGYRIGDNVHIQAGFQYSEGMNPYYSDPFNRNPFLNDAYGSPSSFGIPRW